MRRSDFLTGSAAAIAAISMPQKFAQIERSTGGRLGVFALDTATREQLAYRAGERFPMCSTFKLLLVAGVLSRVDRGEEQLDRRVWYGKNDVLEYAPITKDRVRDGMTVHELCQAAIEVSDNTAANLLLKSAGGPHGLTAYVRGLGDRYTRLDRNEPSLNAAIPGDPRDTTTPAAMGGDMEKIVLGNALSVLSRGTLQAWLSQCKTGTDLLRAGFPSSWQAGDKSGSGGPHNRAGAGDTHNDVAVAWPPGRAPILIAAYLTQSQLDAAGSDAALASVGRVAAAAFTKKGV